MKNQAKEFKKLEQAYNSRSVTVEEAANFILIHFAI